MFYKKTTAPQARHDQHPLAALAVRFASALCSMDEAGRFERLPEQLPGYTADHRHLRVRGMRGGSFKNLQALQLQAHAPHLKVFHARFSRSASRSVLDRLQRALEERYGRCAVFVRQVKPRRLAVQIADRASKHYLRILGVSSAAGARTACAWALASLAGNCPVSGRPFGRTECMKNINRYFPGTMPRREWLDEGVAEHLGEALNTPLLTAAQERGEDLADGPYGRLSPEAARTFQVQRLVEHNGLLACDIAVKTARRGEHHGLCMPLADLLQEGQIGLFEAAKRFDPSRGNRFSTYATYWIQQRIHRFLDNNYELVRLPAHKKPFALSLERGQEGKYACFEEEIHSWSHQRCGQDVHKLLEEAENLHHIQTALNQLSRRKARILRYRAGINGRRWTLEEIGQKFGLTRERVRQLESQARQQLLARLEACGVDLAGLGAA